MVNNDVAGLARCLGANHALHAHNLSDDRVLLLGDVDLIKSNNYSQTAYQSWQLKG